MSEQAKRDRLRALMAATAKNERNWHYLLRRPLTIPTHDQAIHGTVYADCSFGVKSLCRLSNVADPTGDGPGYGNSTSIYLHCPHTTLDRVQAGDAIVFGALGSQHAVMVYSIGKRTPATVKVWSHGQEAGPIIVSLAAEIAAHPGAPVTYCRTIAPDPKPPKPPHWSQVAATLPPLWAWISWRDHGAPAGLRPTHLPRLIPPTWWLRYKRHTGASDPS